MPSIRTKHHATVIPACAFNPLASVSDQDRISCYNINTLSNKRAMRKRENIN